MNKKKQDQPSFIYVPNSIGEMLLIASGLLFLGFSIYHLATNQWVFGYTLSGDTGEGGGHPVSIPPHFYLGAGVVMLYLGIKWWSRKRVARRIAKLDLEPEHFQTHFKADYARALNRFFIILTGCLSVLFFAAGLYVQFFQKIIKTEYGTLESDGIPLNPYIGPNFYYSLGILLLATAIIRLTSKRPLKVNPFGG